MARVRKHGLRLFLLLICLGLAAWGWFSYLRLADLLGQLLSG